MADVLDELLNAGSVDPKQLSALLREQKQIGLAGQLSGSDRLAGPGAAMNAGATAAASSIGENSASDALNRWKTAMAAQSKRAEIAGRQSEGDLNRQNRLDVAGLRNRGLLAGISARNAAKGAGALGTNQASSFQDTISHLGDMADIADQAREQSGWTNTGLAASSDIIPGSPARKLKERMVPLLSTEAMDKLSELRKQAQAMGQKGSGLGQVTENELALLKGARRSLDAAQGEEQLDAALTFLAKQYRSSMAKIQKELDKLQGGGVDGPQDDISLMLQDAGVNDDFEDPNGQ